ncbi:MAG: hemolysin family protein, partial [Anaerolineales bacterium]|nr:hemolysin family protein [Anaerolineales bacterium]
VGVKSSGGSHSVIYTVDELKELLAESEQLGTIESPQLEMLDAVFDFNQLLVRQVMIPRTEIIAIPFGTSLDESINIVVNTRFTKFPIFEGDLDNISGIINIKDLLRAKHNDPDGNLTTDKLGRAPVFVPESSSVRTLLNLFQKHRRHIAIVLDEYGGTAGLITLEDLLEEIVGEIDDPFDDEGPEIQRVNQTTVMVDGLTLIDDVNETLGTEFHDENYDTIAGYFLGHLDHIPNKGEEINLGGGIQLLVIEMDGLRISKIQIKGV